MNCRYTITPKINGKKLEVAYGFDYPLGEYFIQVFDYTMLEDKELIFWKSSNMDNIPNSKMIEYWEKYQVPIDHLNLLALDLPLPASDDR